jgi:3'-5' exoribonuclease
MKRFLKELKEKEHFQSTFLVTDKFVSADRNGKKFMSLTFADATGQLNARMFEKVDEQSPGFDIGDVVWSKGFVQLFKNSRQLILQEVRKAREGEFEMKELIAEHGGNPQEHLTALLAIVGEVKNDFIKQILTHTLNDEDVKTRLLKAPAAKTIHHAYRGGLIEHIHSIVDVMYSLAKHYTFLDLDLLVFGAIYHDLGKIFELDLSEGIHYTHSGRLVGHMAIACEMIDKHSAQIPWFPQDLKDVLKHIVLSHHGKLEYGSPKLPVIAEALVVAMIDDLDSRMNTLFHFLKAEVEGVPSEEKWSHYHPGFERNFYLDFFRKKL